MTELLKNFHPAKHGLRKSGGYTGAKNNAGSGYHYPEPQMDWVELRALKVRCEAECGEFNHVEGCCRNHWLPSRGCHGLHVGRN